MRMFLALLAVAVAGAALANKDHKIEELKDGWVRIVTPSYSLEVPRGWEVSQETSFGQREMTRGEAQMTAMTAAGAGERGWDSLYRTAVWFSTRGGGKATPYKIEKAPQGYEAMTYSVVDDSGFAKSRYVILKSSKGTILALSVKIPERRRESEMMRIFKRMVETAKLVD